MSNYIANVATNVLPIGNVMFRGHCALYGSWQLLC